MKLSGILFSITLAAALMCGAPIAFAADAPTSTGFLTDLVTWAWSTFSAPLAVSGLVSVLMAHLPQGADGTRWDTVRTVLNYVAFNYGNARNARTV